NHELLHRDGHAGRVGRKQGGADGVLDLEGGGVVGLGLNGEVRRRVGEVVGADANVAVGADGKGRNGGAGGVGVEGVAGVVYGAAAKWIGESGGGGPRVCSVGVRGLGGVLIDRIVERAVGGVGAVHEPVGGVGG